MPPERHKWPLQLSRRVEAKGRLRLLSALHVGGGVGSTSITDAGVVRHADGRPYVPGSSLKGALRSHVERLCQNDILAEAGANSCLLYPPDEDEESWSPTAGGCPTLAHVRSNLHNQDVEAPEPTDLSDWSEERTDSFLSRLCSTCTLFGSPYLAGKIRVPDLEVDERTYSGEVEIRDGVGIDRDRGRAVDEVKFDYEVVPSDTVFELSLSVDSPDPVELGLLAIAVRELQRGKVAIGGKTSRGLGKCRLEGVEIQDTKLDSMENASAYFKSRAGEDELQAVDTEEFLDECVGALLD